MPADLATRSTGVRDRVIEALVVVLAIGYLVWPTLRGGDLLGRDMVFVPHPPLDLQSLGLGGSARAVPLDAVIGVVQWVLGSWLAARLALIVPLALAAYGARRLLPGISLPARTVLMALMIINPYVIERLAIGQWAVLWAYGALPWIVHVLTRRDRSLARAIAWCALASITPTGGIIALVTGVVVTVLSDTGWRIRAGYAAAGLALQLPWVLAGFVGDASLQSDPAGVTVFAAHGAGPGGVLVSVLSFGGIWNSEVVPPSQAGVLPLVLAILVLACLIAGWRPLVTRLDGGSDPARTRAVLAALSVLGLMLALLPTTGLGADLIGFLVSHVPGAGLLRDSQKWIMPFVLLGVLSVGTVIARWTADLRGPGWARLATLVGAAVLPVAMVPDAHLVLRPALTPVTYPDDWQEVAGIVGSDDVTVVLPWSAYRGFGWGGDRSVLDPASRVLDGVTITNDELVVGDVTVAGESQAAAEVAAALRESDPLSALAELGVDYVLIEHQTPGRVPQDIVGDQLDGGEVVYDGSALTLIAIASPATGGPAAVGSAPIALAYISHLVFLLIGCAAAATVVLGRLRIRATKCH